jgi:flagellin
MALSINTNIAAINATRKLTGSSNSLNRTFERLSSGLRVNGARDDAAGLAI